MARLLNREWIWGLLAVLATAAIWVSDPFDVVAGWRQAAFEVVGTLFPRPPGGKVTVIDIDRESLEQVGPWPWRRSLIADLIAATAKNAPAAIGVNILIAGKDQNGPTALADKLSAMSGEPVSAPGLVDDDGLLADAIAAAGNVALGLVLDDEGDDPPPAATPLEIQGGVGDIAPLFANGLRAPFAPITVGAAGIGALSLREGRLGRVTSVPILTLAGSDVFPGLAVEAARLADFAAFLTVNGDTRTVEFADRAIPIDERAEMRLHLSDPHRWPERTISAWRLLDPSAPAVDALAGTVAIIGASAPEAGAFLPIAGIPLAPTVQLQAEAVDQILSGAFIVRPETALWFEAAAMLVLGAIAVLAATWLSPMLAVAAEVLLVLVWLSVVVLAFRSHGMLLDSIGPVVAVVLGANATALIAYVQTRQLKTAIVHKFERYVPPEVVARLLRQPDELRLDGELRELTVMATDVESFSKMTERASPQELVKALDGYFDLVTDLIVEHGGMVDKIVGDAVLAYFNIPTEVPDHTAAAVRCAQAVIAATEEYRRQAGVADIGFGRTRCGIEAGTAIVGDVGGQRRLDYTAYGTVVNQAARFEGANKRLGSSICIGPAAAARLDPQTLRCLGDISVHGMDEVFRVYEPWRPGVPADIRAAYAEAMDLVATNPERAGEIMREVAGRLPDDPVVKAMVESLPAPAASEPVPG